MNDREPSLDGIRRAAWYATPSTRVLRAIEPFLDFGDKEERGGDEIIEHHDRDAFVIFLVTVVVLLEGVVKHAESGRRVHDCGVEDGEGAVGTCGRTLGELRDRSAHGTLEGSGVHARKSGRLARSST